MVATTNIIAFGILIVICIIIAIVYVAYREEKHISEPVIFFNWLSHKTGGRAVGKIISSMKGAGGRHLVEFKPMDIGLEEKKKRIIPKKARVILGKGKKVDFPKGTLSGELNLSFGLPKHADDFPDAIKNTEFGKFLMFYTELTNATNNEIDALKEGFDRQSRHIKEMGFGEVSVERMDQMEGLFKDMLEMVKDGKKDKVSTTFTPTNQNFGGV